MYSQSFPVTNKQQKLEMEDNSHGSDVSGTLACVDWCIRISATVFCPADWCIRISATVFCVSAYAHVSNLSLSARSLLCTIFLSWKPQNSGVPEYQQRGVSEYLQGNIRKRRGIWSGRRDLNPRPPRPKRGALPGCATPRQSLLSEE